MVDSSRRWSRLLVVVPLLLVLLLVGIILLDGSTTKNNNTAANHYDDSALPQRRSLGQEATCEAVCENPTFKDLEYFEGQDMLQPEVMLKQLQSKREEWIKGKLQKDYGNVYLDLFQPVVQVMENNNTVEKRVSIGRHLIFRDPTMISSITKAPANLATEGGVAWSRMIRKMQMKILQIQLGILEERKNAKPICLDDCAKKQVAEEQDGSRRGRRRHLARKQQIQASGGLYTKFTWATGGHRSVSQSVSPIMMRSTFTRMSIVVVVIYVVYPGLSHGSLFLLLFVPVRCFYN
jgi:hypothetical protein